MHARCGELKDRGWGLGTWQYNPGIGANIGYERDEERVEGENRVWGLLGSKDEEGRGDEGRGNI